MRRPTRKKKPQSLLGRDEFLARLRADFKDVVDSITPGEAGLLHCEVGRLLSATERAMDEGHLYTAQSHFLLVAEFLPRADDYLKNALEVSYLEDLALGECTPARYKAVKERMPRHLRQILIGHHSNWR
jgi:hypothetical protein